MNYLGLILDKNRNYKKNLEMIAKRIEEIMTALGRLVLNIGRQKEKRRKLLISVVHSVFLYEALVWAPAVHWFPEVT